MQRSSPARAKAKGFTLVEILVSISLLVFIIVILGTITGHIGKIWTEVNAQNQRRATARALLQFIAKDLQSVRLPNTFTTGTAATGSTIPGPGVLTPGTSTGYLQLVANLPTAGTTNVFPGGITSSTGTSSCMNPHALFWQAPIGDNGAMAEVGYYVRWIGNKSYLCRYYKSASASTGISSGSNQYNWASDAIANTTPNTVPYTGLLAENVLALFVRCLNESGQPILLNASGHSFDPTNNTPYAFDSLQGYQDKGATLPGTLQATYPAPALPAAIEITLVVVDANTAKRITAPLTATVNAPSATQNLSMDIQTFISGTSCKPIRSGVEVFSTTVFLPRPPK